MSEKVNVAVIGCGAMAQAAHLPNIQKHPEIELRWCCDVNEKTLKCIAEKFSPQRTTTDAGKIARDKKCDAVIISTTHDVRLPLIRMFAKKGKGIYVEKPMARNFSEMKNILKIVRDTGVVFTVGHNRRKSPAVLEALRIYKKHVASGKSPGWRWDRVPGRRFDLPAEKQTMMLLRINDDYLSWKPWAYDDGMLIGEMTHFADLACYFIDKDPVSVNVTGSAQANQITTIAFPDGSITCIFAASNGTFGYPKEVIEIYTHGAAIIIDHHIELRVAGVVDEPFRRVFPIPSDPYPEIKTDGGISDYYRKIEAAQKEALGKGDNSILPPFPDKGHYALLTDFVRAVREGGHTVCNAEEAAVGTAIVFRAMESVKKGRAVAIKRNDYTV